MTDHLSECHSSGLNPKVRDQDLLTSSSHSQEMQYASRPLTHQRPSLSTPSSSLPTRQSHARTNSHSLLTGALNPNHRVTRRKSVTTQAPNVAALTAVIADPERSPAIPIANGTRRNTMSKSAAFKASIAASLPSPPASLPSHKMAATLDSKPTIHADSAIDDDSNPSADEGSDNFQSARMRRASDGQPLSKDGKKGSRVEVRCEQCGKSYKHSSCLTKHLWEHTPEWNYTSKLLISKHQQVQLLEAASVLVAMNGTNDSATTPPDSTKDFSETDATSPAASGYSEQAERQSSADTTPPPMSEGLHFDGMGYRSKRLSSTDTIARSFQAGSMPNGEFGQWASERRPSSPGRNHTGKDDRDLAAAVELLSCSFNSNSGSQGTVTIPTDAPPVPPLPTQYAEQARSLSNAGFINSFPSRQPESFTRGEFRRDSEDVKMEDSAESAADEDELDHRSHHRSDEDDDGVFGRMEE